MNIESIQQIKLIKYYNRIMNLNFEESIIEYMKREILLL